MDHPIFCSFRLPCSLISTTAPQVYLNGKQIMLMDCNSADTNISRRALPEWSDRPRDLCQLTLCPPPPTMGKRKAKNTLTKINPGVLKYKPVAVSQHASQGGARVTTTVNPICPPSTAPPTDPFFDPDPGNFSEECDEDDGTEEDVLREYYVSRVRAFSPSLHFETHFFSG